MPQVKVEDFNNAEYQITKVVMDNTPDLADTTGKSVIKNFEQALNECYRVIEKGYQLTDFWSNPDVGVEFILKKRKNQEH